MQFDESCVIFLHCGIRKYFESFVYVVWISKRADWKIAGSMKGGLGFRAPRAERDSRVWSPLDPNPGADFAFAFEVT